MGSDWWCFRRLIASIALVFISFHGVSFSQRGDLHYTLHFYLLVFTVFSFSLIDYTPPTSDRVRLSTSQLK